MPPGTIDLNTGLDKVSDSPWNVSPCLSGGPRLTVSPYSGSTSLCRHRRHVGEQTHSSSPNDLSSNHSRLRNSPNLCETYIEGCGESELEGANVAHGSSCPEPRRTSCRVSAGRDVTEQQRCDLRWTPHAHQEPNMALASALTSPHWGLNPGASVYKTDALPLSYRGSCWILIRTSILQHAQRACLETIAPPRRK